MNDIKHNMITKRRHKHNALQYKMELKWNIMRCYVIDLHHYAGREKCR